MHAFIASLEECEKYHLNLHVSANETSGKKMFAFKPLRAKPIVVKLM